MNEVEERAHPLQVPSTNDIKDFTPVTPLERIETIDILRGFALFGVLVCNMKGFSLPRQAYFGGADWPTLTPLDHVIDQFILFAMKGKFMALFSFLFGLGLAIQLSRAKAKGVSVVPRYLRRLTILFFFGVAHVLLFWEGDILHTYALVGFILVLFRNLSLKGLERGFVICVTLMILGGFVDGALIPRRPVDQVRVAQRKLDTEKAMREQVLIYSQGTYAEQIRSRMKPDVGPGSIPSFIELLALFFMGLYAGKRRIFQEVEENRAFIRKCMWFGLAVGVGGSIMFVPQTAQIDGLRFLRNLFVKGIGPFFFLFYAGGLVLLIHGGNPHWRSRLAFLGPVGRMALTNYLTHSIVASFIFYNYGLGYFGKMGSTAGLLLSFAIFAFQIVFSAWWLKRFQFGPMEWIWRSLTYGKMQPMQETAL